eukprot:10054999-Lingulodinium_polyedra.AAC.1
MQHVKSVIMLEHLDSIDDGFLFKRFVQRARSLGGEPDVEDGNKQKSDEVKREHPSEHGVLGEAGAAEGGLTHLLPDEDYESESDASVE